VTRIYLSPPDIGEADRVAVLRALDSGWVAPAGPELPAFESELAAATGRAHAVALASGTAALHLALVVLGVQRGDEVLVPTLTFVASANAVRYVNARPTLVDSESRSWNVDPELIAQTLEDRRRSGRPPAAVMSVDLYGRTADYGRLLPICAEYGAPLIADAAEALGASCDRRPAGAFGVAAVLSFNGNKIITTSGGGALVTDDDQLAARVRHLSTQAREPDVHYEHTEVGFNYRMSNVLAALGRAQLATLEERVARRSAIEARYRLALEDLAGVAFAPEPSWGYSNHWLTCLTIDPALATATRDSVIRALEEADIEARPMWKPMHRQPLYVNAPAVITGVADRVFEHGLCLPSGSNLDAADQDRVINIVRRILGG
jgi:pyridoxal phosphate-dependent aminotransferase EpsN